MSRADVRTQEIDRGLNCLRRQHNPQEPPGYEEETDSSFVKRTGRERRWAQ